MDVSRGVACALLTALAGCSLITDSFQTNGFSGDQDPINIDLASGAVLLGLRQDGTSDRTAVLDVLSPLTVVDPGPDQPPSVSIADVFVLGEVVPGGPIEQPRAKFTEAQLISLHPCEATDCVVGPTAGERTFQAIIGADALAGDAARLRLGDRQVFILPDIAGDEVHRTRACDAVFPSPYAGGGTLVIAGSELGFIGRRPTVEACLGFDARSNVVQGLRGADVLFVVSSGVGTSILSETAYKRYVDSHPCPAAPGAPACALPLEQLATFATVNLPSGKISGRVAQLDSIALVANSSSTPRAPCRQVYGSHLLVQRDCEPGEDCPCENGDKFCSMPAVVELTAPTGLDVLVVSDANPTLQALGTELGPDQPQVDGILGTDALITSEVDFDYPHDRILGRCSTDQGCVTRPELGERDDRPQVQGCLGPAPAGPIF